MKELEIQTEHDRAEFSLYEDKLYISIFETYGDTAHCFLSPESVQSLKQFLNENFK